MEIFRVIKKYLIKSIHTITLLFFQLFKPEWAELALDKKVRNSSISCTNCAEFEQQVQEKHELVLTLVNKGNEIQKELQTCQEQELEFNKELMELRKSNEDFVKILNEYEEKLREAISGNIVG